MSKFKKWSTALLAGLVVMGVGIASNAIAKELKLAVYTYNQTDATFKATETVGSKTVHFNLKETPISKMFPLPSSGTATLSAYFVDKSSETEVPPCSKSFNVATSSLAIVNVVHLSSGTYGCNIEIP